MAGLGPRPRFCSVVLFYALIVCFAACLRSTMCAQTSDPVQIVPRADATKINTSREAAESLSGATGRSARFHVDVDLVLVPVTVTDTLNRPVIGLNKESFELLDSGEEQRIRFFSLEDAPISVALILDVSESMSNMIVLEQAALGRFFENANPEDEYFAIGISTRPTLLADSTQRIADIQDKLASARPEGYTALLDGIYMGLNKLKSARHQRRAMLIISDGGENHSQFKYQEVKEFAEELDVLVYAIRPVDAAPIVRTIGEKLGNRLLSGITEATGGQTILLSSSDNIPRAAATISRELRTEYVLGYHPPKMAHAGKSHKIKVRMLKSNETSPLRVRYRKQYSAPGS